MPDMNERIATWRMDIARQLGDDTEVLDELESHLRDEIANLVQRGETPEHALELAANSIGPPKELAQEFAKATTWGPIKFVLGGAMLLLGAAIWFIFSRPNIAAREAVASEWLYPHIITVLIGYMLSFAIGALANCYAVRRAWGDLSLGQMAALNRAQYWTALSACVLTTIAVVLGGVWSSLARDVFWSWDQREVGGLLVVASQAMLFISVWRFPAARRWLMCLGMLASFTVTYAWFGGILSWSLVIVVVAQTPFLLAGLAPSGWLRRCVHRLRGRKQTV